MGCTIVRIAGKLATCDWLTPMATDTAWIECTLDADPRLIHAIATIMVHAAARAGFSEKLQEEIAAAFKKCHPAFLPAVETKDTSSPIKLRAADSPDHIEVTIEPAAGTSQKIFDEIAKSVEVEIRKALTGPLVNSTRCETRDGILRVTFAKNA
jgi:hypothetical protein